MNKLTSFQKSVYGAVRKVPRGRVATYAEVARVVGVRRAYRAVGNALNKNPFMPQVPCHRVVKSDGTLGGFASGQKVKIKVLQQEGIVIEKGRVVDFEKKFYSFK